MRRIILIATLCCAFSASAAERVLDFHSDIRVNADGTLVITERIAVQAEGREIRRGILRDFPTDYRDRYGNKVHIPFEVKYVTRNGLAERYALQRLANGVRIRIGAADVMLERGVHVYEITYRTARQVGHFEAHDELYWNVNGNGWTFAFDRISAEVHLPQKVPAKDLKVEAYTGAMGATGRHYQSFVSDGSIAFRSNGVLPPRHGMTIVVAFPKGIVHEPGWPDRTRWFLDDNRGALAGLAGLALLLGFLWWRWWLVGRDPRAGPKFPRYDAPKGIGPAGVRYVDRMAYDERCFACGLLGLGSRGFLKIREAGENFVLDRTGKAVDWLPGERPLSAMLQGPGKPTFIGKEYNLGVAYARNKFRDELEHYFGNRLFSRNRGSQAAGFIIAAATLGLMFLLDAPWLPLAATGALMAVILIVFWQLLPAYSVAGRKLQDEIEGLRQYLGVAERDELSRNKAPPKTPEEFSKFLPYAVALDVEKTWADRFAQAIGVAAVAQAVSGWYDSSSGFGDAPLGGLTDSFSDLGSTISAASSPPGSSSGDSGGGGGGSSGGGGGGGGGSGW